MESLGIRQRSYRKAARLILPSEISDGASLTVLLRLANNRRRSYSTQNGYGLPPKSLTDRAVQVCVFTPLVSGVNKFSKDNIVARNKKRKSFGFYHRGNVSKLRYADFQNITMKHIECLMFVQVF